MFFPYFDPKLDWIIPLTLEVSLTNRLAQELDAVTNGTRTGRVTAKNEGGKEEFKSHFTYSVYKRAS